MRPMHRLLLAALVGAAGCAEDGGSSWKAGVFEPSSELAGRCVAPRIGIDASTGQPYADVAGSTLTENEFLRSWTNETYLWYREVPDLDPEKYRTTIEYFDLLKTNATTPSGKPKDGHHFRYATDKWIERSRSGIAPGYGAQFLWVAPDPPRSILVAYTEPRSPAAAPQARLARGARVLAVDGVDVVNAVDEASMAVVNAGLYPAASGEAHGFSVLDPGASAPRAITMVSAKVALTPVLNVGTLRADGGTVGYLLFNEHIAPAERLLIEAFEQLAAARVSDLVLDIRYNGGGWIALASQLAYMVAGPARTTGRTFDRMIFNDKHTTTDIDGRPLAPLSFLSTSIGFSVPCCRPLPTLNLPRVVVLTGGNTCSASETIINGLRGVGVQVIAIGHTTCGKPYGWYPKDNCGTTYFSIQFQGVNDQGFGDYADGFSPANAAAAGVPLPGCSVPDDLTHALGDRSERRLAAALDYLAGHGCPTSGATVLDGGRRPGATSSDGLLRREPWREMRLDRW